MKFEEIRWSRRTLAKIKIKHEIRIEDIEAVFESKAFERKISDNERMIIGRYPNGLMTIFVIKKESGYWGKTARPSNRREKVYYKREVK
jgi:uncharacterized DUF497 family protein